MTIHHFAILSHFSNYPCTSKSICIYITTLPVSYNSPSLQLVNLYQLQEERPARNKNTRSYTGWASFSRCYQFAPALRLGNPYHLRSSHTPIPLLQSIHDRTYPNHGSDPQHSTTIFIDPLKGHIDNLKVLPTHTYTRRHYQNQPHRLLLSSPCRLQAAWPSTD